MNNQLTDLEIVQVFGHYPLCPVAIFDDQSDPNAFVPDKVEGVILDLPQIFAEKSSNDPKKVRLQLIPVHHMSNEDIVKACRCYDNIGFMTGKDITVNPGNAPGIKQVIIADSPYSYKIDTNSGSIAIMWNSRTTWAIDTALHLTQHYFKERIAIPLYFDYGHWANGKTAIELGIAIPDRMILTDLLKKKFDNDLTEIGNWWLENEKLNINDLTVMDDVLKSLKMELNEPV